MSGFTDLVAASAESLLTQDLRLRAGTTWSRTWIFYDNDDALINFAGATATLTIKDKVGGTQLVSFTQTLTSGRQIVLSNGSIQLTATVGATSPLNTGITNYHGVYELRVTKAGDTVSVVTGRITIFPPV